MLDYVRVINFRIIIIIIIIIIYCENVFNTLDKRLVGVFVLHMLHVI